MVFPSHSWLVHCRDCLERVFRLIVFVDACFSGPRVAGRDSIVLGLESPFFSNIVLFKTGSVFLGIFAGFWKGSLERMGRVPLE